MANYTRVKIFAFWKVSVKLYHFRVPVFKGVPLPWMKWNPSLNDECWSTVVVWTVSLSEKWVLNYTTLGSPFIRGFPSHEWNETRPFTMTAGQVAHFKRVPLPWMKWNPSFNDDWWPTVRVWKVSLSEKLVLFYKSLGFPFIKGFPSYGWSDTNPLTVRGG